MKKVFTTIIAFHLFSMSFAQNRFLYGLTQMGGSNNNGVIFAFNPFTQKDTVLVNLSLASGVTPQYASFLKATNGILYATTYEGGANSDGTILSYNPSTGKDSVVLNFNGTDGEYPAGPLMQANDGLLYGLTYQGGSGNSGVLFSYNPLTGKDSTRFSFTHTNGAQPIGGLMQASDNLLYGLTQTGGTQGYGVLFSYDLITGKDSTRISFIGTSRNADDPYASLVQASNGLLYGTSHDGGTASYGTIFSYDITTGVEDSLIVNFNGTNGTYPNCTLFMATNGLLYGTTALGGVNNDGVIFTFNPVTKAYNIVYNFNGSQGEVGDERFVQDNTTGLLYGMTNQGGVNNKGVLFSFDTASKTYTDLLDFNGTNGDYPLGGLCFADSINTQNHEYAPVLKPSSFLLNASPNPFNRQTIITFNANSTHYLEITAISGKRLKLIKCSQQHYIFKRQGLANGIYFIKCYNNKNEYQGAIKIILQ